MDNLGERLQRNLLGFVQELVDKPDDANVEAVVSPGGGTVILTVTTAKGDIGKVIGKQGKTAYAFRYLLEAMAAKHKIKVVLEIDDEAS